MSLAKRRSPISIELPSRIIESVFGSIFGVLTSKGTSDRDASLHRYHRETLIFRRKFNRVLHIAMLNTWMNADEHGRAFPRYRCDPTKSTDMEFSSRWKNWKQMPIMQAHGPRDPRKSKPSCVTMVG
ncbi:uncharacterized protein LOC112459452 [Temnothorax curvispinosus]|uniref:Uncharacterized protein LOC112459452 n=1 Tax=Temnothorax curvispinosus TaxID=300111 RepID=A0A6J1QAN6_9HYME|nr:uncharacterized protein LOC112459452 [Temnothorax curvispinosus]